MLGQQRKNKKNKKNTLGKWVSEQRSTGGSKLTEAQRAQLIELVGPLEQQRKRK